MVSFERYLNINSSVSTGPPSTINFYNDILYIADEFNHRVLGINKDGEHILEIGSKGSSVGEFHYPKGLAFDSKGNLFVADCWNHRLQRFSSDGKNTACFGSYGNNPGQFNEPFGIAIDKDDRIFVTERCNHRVQVFGPDCKSEGFWGARGTAAEELCAGFYNTPHHKLPPQLFEFPTSIAINSKQELFIVDSGNHRIQGFSNKGDFIKSFGHKGTGEGEFQYPYGIAIDCNNNLFVSDFNNNRIQVFNAHGEFISSINNIHSPTSLYSISKSKLFTGSAFNSEIKLLDINITNTEKRNTNDSALSDIKLNSNEEDLCNIEKKISLLKKELIATSKQLAEKAVFIENSKRNAVSLPVELEKQEYNLHKREEDLREELFSFFCLYKRSILKHYNTANTLFRYKASKKSIMQIYIDRFFNLSNELAYLFSKKDDLEDEAEKLYKTSSQDDNEANINYRKALSEIFIINNFLSHMIIVFSLYINIINSFVAISSKYDDLASFFSEAFKSSDSIIKSVSKIFTSFNNDWSFMVWGWGTKIDHDSDVSDGLKTLFSNTVLREALEQNCNWSLPLTSDERLTEKIQDDDLFVVQIFKTISYVNNDKDTKIILENIKSIQSDIVKKEDEVNMYCEEIAKYQNLKDAVINDAAKSSRVLKKLMLLELDYTLIKKSISEQFNILTVLFYKLCKISHKKTDEIDNLLTCFSDKINVLNKIYKNLYAKWEKEIHERMVNKNMAGENQLGRLRLLLQHITFYLNRYNELKALAFSINSCIDSENSLPDFKLTYDRTFLKSVDKDEEIKTPAAFAADDDGNLYISEWVNHRIKKVSKNGEFISNFGSFGNLPGKFNNPAGIAIDKNSYLYICDSGNNRVQKFSTEGDFIGSFGKTGSGIGEFNFPYRIFIDDDGFIYVNDSGNHRIQKFDNNGSFISVLAIDEQGNGLIKEPTGFSVLNNGNIIIAGKLDQSLHIVNNRNRNVQKIMGREGRMPGEFNFITDITSDKNGNIYVTDFYNCRVQVFDKDLEFLSLIDSYGDTQLKFNGIGAVFVNREYLYVADYEKGAIHRYKI